MLGLFKKKNAPQQNTRGPAEMSEQDKEFERKRKIVAMQKTLEEMRQRIDDSYRKIDSKQVIIKDLIRNKRKTEAKRHLVSLKALQEEVQKQENMCIILEKTKIQLEVTSDTSKVVDVFKDAATLQKEVERNRDYLEDYMVDKKDMEEQNAEIGRILNDLALGDPQEAEEIDQMYAALEGEALEENIDMVNKEPLRDVHRPAVIQSTANQSTRTNTTTQSMKESTIDDLLADMVGH